MDAENEYELNDLLDITLSKARNIGMRGELIDVCEAIKDFRDRATNGLVELPKKNGNFEEEKFEEMEFFQFFDKKDDYNENNFAKLYENKNLVENLNQVMDAAREESLISETQSDATRSDATGKGYVT